MIVREINNKKKLENMKSERQPDSQAVNQNELVNLTEMKAGNDQTEHVPKATSIKEIIREQIRENILLVATIVAVILGISIGFIIRSFVELNDNQISYFGFIGQLF